MGELKYLGPTPVEGFAGQRTIRVYLPSGYHQRGAHRVLYLFDGQNVFDDGPSFAGGWHVHEAVEKLAAKRRPIVVGIDHGGPSRMAELSPFSTARFQGRADAFVDWIVKHLQPWMAHEFKVVHGPEGSVIGGSSLGGLAAMYAHFRRPEAFGGALCMSPSFWVGGGGIFRFVESQSNPWTSRVYLDCGVREGGMVRIAERMAMHLRARGYGDDKLLWRPDSRGAHNERHWRRRMPKALRFFT